MDLTVIEQRPIPLADIKEKLGLAKKDSKDLSFRAEKVYNYINDLDLPSKEKMEQLHKKINELNISRLRDRHITKVLDLMPKDIETLKSIFTGEAVSLKPEELKQILDAITSN